VVTATDYINALRVKANGAELEFYSMKEQELHWKDIEGTEFN
jgi:hypothetical protein